MSWKEGANISCAATIHSNVSQDGYRYPPTILPTLWMFWSTYLTFKTMLFVQNKYSIFILVNILILFFPISVQNK